MKPQKVFFNAETAKIAKIAETIVLKYNKSVSHKKRKYNENKS